MASGDVGKLNAEENFEWNVENEIRLFEAMIGYKPVGINKHFHMACISEKFESLLGKSVPPDLIWKHLGSMYDLAALDKKESIPFFNETEEFSLPEAEFSDLISDKLANKTESHNDTKESTKEGKGSGKPGKDVTLSRETSTKKEKKLDLDESSTNDDDKKEGNDNEGEVKKGKTVKEEKIVKTRGKRSLKDKRVEEDTSSTATSSNKKEEESSLQSSTKKEKQVVGKRTLRSRVEETLPAKPLTPPPVKRARRI